MIELKCTANTVTQLRTELTALLALTEQVQSSVVEDMPTTQPVTAEVAPAPVVEPVAPVTQAPVTPEPAPLTPSWQPDPVQFVTREGPVYSQAELATAASAFVSRDPANNRQKVVGLLAKFDASRLSALKPEQYDAFATDMRGLGADI